MSRLADLLPTALIAAAVGFGAGYYVCHARSQVAPEDFALQGVMQNYAQVAYLERQDLTTARNLANVNLYGHLLQLLENEGHIADPKWLRAKAKTLNSVALIWEGEEPLKDLEFQGDIAKEWAEGYARILLMLQRAKEECRRHPEYQCKTKEVAGQ